LSQQSINIELNTELLACDATTLAAKMAAGDITSESLVRETLAAISVWDKVINSYISVDGEAAITAAKASDQRRASGTLLSPIDGLTFAAKDNIDAAGFVTTGGFNISQTADKATEDAAAIKSLRDAGRILLGKLNMHEAALGATNDNPHHGKCFNPHNLTCTPGGSSGGSGASVAAGLCCFSLGTDTMGSVRIPAAYCGVSGLKASVGAISTRGVLVASRRLDNVGPIARSPRDLQLILSVMGVYDSQSAQSRQYSFQTDAIALKAVKTLNVAVGIDLNSVGIEPEVQTAFDKAVSCFSQAGAQIVERSIADFDFGASRRAGLLLCEVDAYLGYEKRIAETPEIFSPDLLSLLQWGVGKSSLDLYRADVKLDKAAQKGSALLSGCDFLLLPTAPQAAFNFAEPTPNGQADLTNFSNMSGHPSVSVPMGKNSAGMPMGLQIVGPHGSDLQLLDLAQWFAEQEAEPINIPQALLALKVTT
jgi:Asp-tRNA(Asn)/Glu-tRNA(Gln) amidotransferase A subunit family amidase